jgi:hypothetical protein
MSWQGAAVAAVVGLTAMDIVIRKMTGSGLLDWLSGAAQKQREYNQALEEYANVQERINALEEVGMSEAEARATVIAEKAALLKEKAEIVALATKYMAEVGNDPLMAGDLQRRIDDAKLAMDVIKADLEAMQGGRPTPLELIQLTGGDPILTGLYAERLKEIDEAKQALQVKREAEQINALAKSMREAAEGTQEMGESAAEAKAAYSALGAAITLALDQFKAPDPVLAMLKLEQEELERTKAKLGDAFGPEQEARLRALNAAIEDHESALKVAENAIAVYGYSLSKAIGPTGAAEQVKKLANYLADLDEPTLAEIQMKLPTMQMAEMIGFLAKLEETHNVKVALEFSTRIGAELAGKVKPITEMVAGRLISYMPVSVVDEFKKVTGIDWDSVIADQERLAAAEKEGAASAAALGDASGGAAEQISAEAQALLDLVKAANLAGLSWEEFSFILDVIAKGMKVFNLSAEQMAAILRKSGLAVEEFTRRLWALEVLEAVRANATKAADAVNGLYDAFNRLFAQPTREEAALNLRLAKLKEQREQALQGGKGNVKGYVTELDKSIATIEDELELRRLHNDVLKAELDVADRARITDQNQQQMARNLIDTMGDASQKAADMAWNLWISAAALQAWTTDLGRWMAAVGAAPAYQSGGIVPGSAGQATLAWLHGGEVVLNAAQAGALSRGDINVPITINAESQDFDAIKQAAHAAVEEALTYARARWYRSGASLSASIG